MPVWLDPESFRRAYVAYTRRHRDDDPRRIVRLGEALVGLDALYERYLAGDPDDLDVLFSEQRRADSWEEASSRLRPLIATSPPTPDAVVVPCGELVLGVGCDGPEGAWVRAGQALAWLRDGHALVDHALEQLDRETAALPFTFQRVGRDRFVAFETGDGYDAVRLHLPGLRERVAARLGRRFFAATPSRDYLICWAADASAEFQEFTRNRIREDHATHPRPLSPTAFEVTAAGIATSRRELRAG